MRVLDLPIILLELLPQLLVELQVMSHRIEDKPLMAYSVVEIRVPADVPELLHVIAIHVHKPVIVRYDELVRFRRPKPDGIVPQEWEDLLVRDGIHAAKNHEPLVRLENPSKELPEQGERGGS